jgi:MASE9
MKNSTNSHEHSLPIRARQLILWVSAIGSVVAISALFQRRESDVLTLAAWVGVAVAAGATKFRIPGIESSFSLGYAAVLGALAVLRFQETILVCIITVLVQCYWRPRQRPAALQVLFNLSNYAISAAAAWYAFHGLQRFSTDIDLPARFAVAAAVFFAVNTMLVSWIVAILTQRELGEVWQNSFLLIVPFYLVGVAAAGLLGWSNNASTWVATFGMLVLAYISTRARLIKVTVQTEPS